MTDAMQLIIATATKTYSKVMPASQSSNFSVKLIEFWEITSQRFSLLPSFFKTRAYKYRGVYRKKQFFEKIVFFTSKEKSEYIRFPNLTKTQNYAILKRKEMPELGLSPLMRISRQKVSKTLFWRLFFLLYFFLW